MDNNIRFKKIIISHYKSIGYLKFKFKGSGLTFIRGKNGAGKTSLFDALYFCLYGENIKGLTQNKLITKKEYVKEKLSPYVVTSIQVNKTNYDILRSMDSKLVYEDYTLGKGLFIFKNGKLKNFKGVDDAQHFLKALLGISSKLFIQSVMFGKKMKRFIEGSNTDRKMLLDELLDLSFIDKAKENVATEIDTTQREIYEGTNKKLDLKENIEIIKNSIKEVKQEIKYYKDSIKTEKQYIKENKGLLIEHGEDVGFKKSKKKLKQLNKQKDEYEHNLDYEQYTQNDLDFLYKRFSELTEQLGNFNLDFDEKALVCSKCGTKLKGKLKQKEKKKHEKLLTDKHKKLQSERDDVNYKISLAKKSIDTQNKYKTHLDFLNTNIKKLNDYLSAYNTNKVIKLNIKQSKDRLTKFENKLKKYELAKEGYIDSLNDGEIVLENLEEKIKDATKELDLLGYWNNKGFTNKGIKAYLINNFLDTLNTALKVYAQSLGYDIRVFVDFEKASTPLEIECSKKGILFDYKQFSDGESRKVNLSVVCALHDIVCSFNNGFNIMLMDEVFEGLDDDGLHACIELLNIKSNEYGIYIITHKFSNVLYGSDVINVTLKDNLSNYE